MQSQFEQGGGDAAGNVAGAHDRLLTDRTIQFELPTADDAPLTAPPSQSGFGPPSDPSVMPPPQQGPTVPLDPSSAAPPTPAPTPSPAPDLPTPSGGGGLDGVMHVFLWIAAGIALAILLYWLFNFFRDRRPREDGKTIRSRRVKPEAEAWRPAEAAAEQLLDEADVLASQGRFDEAAHLLLYRSIGEIDAHRPDLVRPALTSRDIAGHPALPSRPAAAFSRIAALVERSLFARRPLGPDDWQDCRAAYREFAFADGWQG
jgi:hypothetical protein